MGIKRSIKTQAKSLLHRVFLLGQRVNVTLLPLHFYSNVPDIRDLSRRQDWRAPRSLLGLERLAIPEQIALLTALFEAGGAAVAGRDTHADAVSANGSDEGYGVIEADILAAYIAARRPAKVVQIGCGVSTALILDAARIAGYRPDITCIEPYPTTYLSTLARDGRITLVAEPAQLVDFPFFTALAACDLFFVDSTHSVKPGSEVNRIIFEVLPRLQPGVRVHFHDIYLPYDYAPSTLSTDLVFPNETALLYAYLCENPKYRIELCMSMLHYAAPDAIKRLIPKYDPRGGEFGLEGPSGSHFPSSIFLLRTG
jgi:hypothetical protein